MPKAIKQTVTPMWLEIKEMFKENTNGSDKYGTNFPIGGELDELSMEFVEMLGVLTRKFGWDYVIEDVSLDLWKERIWSLVENAGLLPEIAWRDDKEKDKLEEDIEEIYDFEEEEPIDLDSNKHINIFE